ncbi:MAG: hypothetical protein J7L15_05360 [Clostridiales bacterium]|nr:hypothetical protein [Clostridiales bacterium]
MMKEKTKRFDEVEIGDIIEVSFSNVYSTPGSVDRRKGIVKKIGFDEDLNSKVICFDFYIVAEYKQNKKSAVNVITNIIKKSENPEYFL